jgi:hypothetical protein
VNDLQRGRIGDDPSSREVVGVEAPRQSAESASRDDHVRK